MRMIGLAALAILAGCATGPAGGGRGLPEVTMARSDGEIVPPARRYLAVAVRSFEPGPDGGWSEVAGATCQATAGPYRATVVTPARLVLPDLGPDAVPLVAECNRGAQRGREALAPVYPWPAETKPDPAQRVLYGGWWRGYQKSGPMRYPDLAVALR